MNIKRFVARTSREALAMVRAELGEDAIVLKNRPVPDGVEILAMAEDALPAGNELADPAEQGEASWAQPRARSAQSTVLRTEPATAQAAEAADPMSTVNFEAYVRDRQARRRSEAQEPAVGRIDSRSDSRSDPRSGLRSESRSALRPELRSEQRPALHPELGQGIGEREHRVEQRRPVNPTRQQAAPADAVDTAGLMSELRAMRGFLSSKIESMSWFEGVRRRPAQANMLRRLIEAGFSAALARKLADHLPADFNDAQAEQWLHATLRRNLKVDAPGESIFDAGGTFALLGPTGVGKTTTAAKIAAQFALKHGAQSVGLITADVYRIGAQDQLRTFGRLLGVPVHVAHDVATLADFLQMSMNRKLVLIDTAGMSQRDERIGELLAGFASAQVRRVVVLNAAMQASAIDEVIEAYQATTAAGVVLSKIDETVQLGGALDCLIRHRLTLQGIANGQRVPEDWHRPDASVLIEHALAARSAARPTPFSFDESELAMLLTASTGRNESVRATTGAHGV